eukprot:4778679-Ditylum_brightwellii.AAC.1
MSASVRMPSLKDIHQGLVKVTLWAWKPKVRDEYTAGTSTEEGPNVTQPGGWKIGSVCHYLLEMSQQMLQCQVPLLIVQMC